MLCDLLLILTLEFFGGLLEYTLANCNTMVLSSGLKEKLRGTNSTETDKRV